MYDTVIFDLDGTLINTSSGIYNSVRYTEKQMGLCPISDEELKEFLGPPPKELYRKKYKLNDLKATMATRYHREYSKKKAVYEVVVYDEIHTLLQEIKARRIKLAVATLKNQKAARRMLESQCLIGYFDVVIGMNEEENLTKVQIIKEVMDVCNSHKCLMVGDSFYDYYGAVKAKVDFIGVLYGFGFNKKEDYNFKTIYSPLQLIELL